MKKILLVLLMAMLAAGCLFGLSACGFLNELSVSEKVHTHSFDEWVITVRPTCLEDGERERYCSCGEKQTGIIASLGHELIEYDAQPATCTQSGWEEYSACSRCEYNTKIEIAAIGHDMRHCTGQSPTCTEVGFEDYDFCSRCDFSNYTEISALGHNFGEWTISTNATCVDTGVEIRVCTHDDCHTETRIIPTIAHSESGWHIVEADCENDGYKYKECVDCHTVLETQTLPALGHNYGEWKQTSAATCSTEGEEIRICSHDSSHIETRHIDKLEHTESDWIIIEPTCEYEGEKYKLCTVCNTKIQSEILQALEHDFGAWTETVQATCSTVGEEIRVCSHNENHTETRIIEKLAHTESDWITIEPTCVSDGICYKICIICNEKLEEELIPATGHLHNADYVKTETFHYMNCATCGEIIESSPHDWYDNTCTTCGYDAGGTKGLNYLLNPDGFSYTVTGIGVADEESEIIIPKLYNGKRVTEISSGAFRNTQINSIIIPNSVLRIGKSAFFWCNNLASISLPFVGSAVESGENYFGYIFGAGSAEENKEFVPASLKEIIITGEIKEIKANAFWGCESVKSITLPNTLEVIGDSAFRLCSGLENILLCEDLTKIGEAAFFGCTGINSLIIPEKVEYIGSYAFYGCAALTNVTFLNTDGWNLYKSSGERLDADLSYITSSATNAAIYLKHESYCMYIWKLD